MAKGMGRRVSALFLFRAIAKPNEQWQMVAGAHLRVLRSHANAKRTQHQFQIFIWRHLRRVYCRRAHAYSYASIRARARESYKLHIDTLLLFFVFFSPLRLPFFWVCVLDTTIRTIVYSGSRDLFMCAPI